MRLFGVDFVPLDEPLHRRLETFWAGFWFLIFVFGPLLFSLPFIYLLFTSYWWVSLIVATLVYLDSETCEKGGRENNWVQSWSCWRFMTDYYNTRLIFDDGFSLDPKQNYIFCAFPHGILPMGPYTGLKLKSSPFQKLYPNFQMKLASLKINFLFPIVNCLMLSMGFVSCSTRSLSYIFNRPEKGTILLLMAGGAEEALKTRNGQYKFVVKNRKGFVKIALKNGVSLVPIITFGETSLFEQLEFSALRQLQQIVKRYFAFAPVVFNGRGFFQTSFGLLPRRTQLTVVLGKPIEIPKEENPTNQQIDDIHASFLTQLERLFEKYKFKYLTDPENTHLELL